MEFAFLYGIPRSELLDLFFLGLTLAHMLVEVSDRYHYSLIPILIIFAARGFAGEERSQL